MYNYLRQKFYTPIFRNRKGGDITLMSRENVVVVSITRLRVAVALSLIYGFLGIIIFTSSVEIIRYIAGTALGFANIIGRVRLPACFLYIPILMLIGFLTGTGLYTLYFRYKWRFAILGLMAVNSLGWIVWEIVLRPGFYFCNK
jgi:hypothetical protein